jgi:hypothetical protein
VVSLLGSPLRADRLRRAALAAARDRTWEAALEWLAAGYRRALAGAPSGGCAQRRVGGGAPQRIRIGG